MAEKKRKAKEDAASVQKLEKAIGGIWELGLLFEICC